MENSEVRLELKKCQVIIAIVKPPKNHHKTIKKHTKKKKTSEKAPTPNPRLHFAKSTRRLSQAASVERLRAELEAEKATVGRAQRLVFGPGIFEF